jgi:hypothetical protein
MPTQQPRIKMATVTAPLSSNIRALLRITNQVEDASRSNYFLLMLEITLPLLYAQTTFPSFKPVASYLKE